MQRASQTVERNCYTRAKGVACINGGPRTRTKYVYNALGQRVQRSGGTVGTVNFFYDEAGHLLGEYDAAGALVEEIVWLGDTPVATIRTDETGTSVGAFYIHADNLNAPTTITRPSNNQIIWRWDRDPFGNGTPNQDPDGNGLIVQFNLRFPGQYSDAESGLYYNYFRDLDPQTGRYVESDPIGLGSDVNTYAYALNRPVSLGDPTGLDVTINISRQGISATGNTVSGTIEATSTVTPLLPIQGLTMENMHAGDCACKAPIPAGRYPAFIRTDHRPNRVELMGVTGYKNIQIHNGSYPRDFKGCFGVGNFSATDFLGGSKATLDAILNLIRADGSGRITVNVNGVPIGPTIPSTPYVDSLLP
jgi:RHS repeat-associated protein